jgi:predicted signal transduction protein with EAL and GGDEF domain
MLTMFAHVEIIELSCMILVVSAMAGGSATVLAAHRLTAMVFVFTLLVPFSILMLMVSGQEYQNILGVLGLSFSIVMMVASKKAADFTTQAIYLKHENVTLLHYMKEQVAARTQEIYALSNIDPLTGLFNRSAFLNEAKLQLQQADIQHEYLALLFIDLDGFKKVNDSIGHAAGYRVLAQTALRLQEQEPDNHLLCRRGGDEYCRWFEFQSGC